MKATILKTAVIVFVSAVAAILETNRSLMLGSVGVNPNLTLILFLLPAVLDAKIKEKIILITAVFTVNALFLGHWLKEVIFLGGFGLAAVMLKKFFFDRPYLDFVVLIVIASSGFYAATDPRYLISYPNLIAAETIYNAVLGIIALSLWRKSLKSI